ncbi:MAG: DNA-formamidopyrimidine glycosylase [Candidatus Brennerbacteria bacterium RIFOXYC1_FULL_41_11]|uniref:DNA-formamidopyrimidine glycosylase n=1 Tax=Candidatus Brennerbacteria bacterium RIFOXYD1_FULL_41_16 TaxID=1797529 RepID=A0A1G1XK48_9BACT|nr:MAG: Formamidopyrimidine-DNA glycosylase [Parcubacteria group bacterium GW2011_GWB1_41_4]OGY39304.1 MAG: DNA-formamidopyrimidine glycosylase [Candidatus Brennerbacteria bacterium RIFOXYB1_FULL_41_13]OGY39707.1 MAG: DNA-formamidopyrimidine glycosylase [Candidatus Brennerbacteria bacterium RIFOXYC1_FULL_41_11]OGY40331.1 MAG: DNA-formamidopyrimidine glycosylase [Candidatus Brennerbacteria bacterium RIFOXYD1_FULL_41_16]
MPELPEVETIRRQLKKAILNKKITKVEVLSKKQFPQNPKLVVGKIIIAVERRAKLLIIKLTHQKNLIIHLKLSGQLIWQSNPPAGGQKIKLKRVIPTVGEFLPSKSTRVILTIGRGKLFFNEMRKFGWIKLLTNVQLDKELQKYGIEPFRKDFDQKSFAKALTNTRRPIKTVLLDQEKIAGIGNIYANESLYLSKIHPAMPANTLNAKQVNGLRENIIKVLKLGLKYGGASDEYYIHPDTTRGTYQNHFSVYGKSGESCRKCRSIIKRISLGGRGTYFCPGCQKAE